MMFALVIFANKKLFEEKVFRKWFLDEVFCRILK
jgi:hypothetical protein